MRKRKLYRVFGVVQGVGFRPFVYRIAVDLGLAGFVRNDTLGVEIEAEGDERKLEFFKKRLVDECPPAALIEHIEEEEIPLKHSEEFRILKSEKADEREILISPDIATCEDCLRELFDPNDRRYLYPFINCTNCGPRYTIIEDVPYDRPNTTMKVFRMCPECRREYEDPGDRRFHAQPNACPVCGPRVWLVGKEGETVDCADPIDKICELLNEGKIVAIKGLGGFHIACDATDDNVVERLREAKKRGDKPFALMAPDIETIEKFCHLSDEERKILKSPRCPIVLLRARESAWDVISRLVAPNNKFIGFMLPYTPLHHLILNKVKKPLVMTSGNRRDEPIIKDNDEALEKLRDIADYFLFHNRGIATRIDDSVVHVIDGKETLIRRARGYAPMPIRLPAKSSKEILALGPMLKCTLCFVRQDKAFLSQYLGDTENYDNFLFLRETLFNLKKLFEFEPEIIVHDLHPDYPTTRLAAEIEGVKLAVQHHEAHIASCIAENGFTDEEFIGIALDGTGYGHDGKIWGGEFFIGRIGSWRRVGHIDYFPLPGGDKAVREPWRITVSILYRLMGEKLFNFEWTKERSVKPIAKILKIADNERFSPLTSSAGRLFDAISSLLSIRDTITYEAQAAIELQMVADENTEESYTPIFNEVNSKLILDPFRLFDEILRDIQKGEGKSRISAKFHNWLVNAIVEFSKRMREEYEINRVALSGGVFQNRLLLEKTIYCLRKEGFEVYWNRKVPVNDGGVSLGQATTAVQLLREGRI